MTRTATLENVIATVDDVFHSQLNIYSDEEYEEMIEYLSEKKAALEFEEFFEA